MRHFLIIIAFLFAGIKATAHNPFWVATDKKLIRAITKLNKFDPKQVEEYFKTQRIQKCSLEKENLGFGWSMWNPGIGGGYSSISARFYYYNDSLVSYSLLPYLPEEKGLRKKYTKWYGNYFSYSNSEIQAFEFNRDLIRKPIKEYKGNLEGVSEKIINYMSPASGTMYGHYGGGVIMKNRRAFLALGDSLTNDEIVYMMYSMNPASRLTAIEYYFLNKDKFSGQLQIDNWIESVFKEVPIIKMMLGCSPYEVHPAALFPAFYLNK